MHSVLDSFAQWLQNTWLPQFISDHPWTYQVAQFVHFTGISLWLGTILGLDLHLLGLGKRMNTSAAKFLKATIIWNWIGLAVAVSGGLTLFSTAAATFVANPAFEIKLFALLPVALAWHIVVQLKTPTWGQSAIEVPKTAKIAGAVEIVLWLCVATAAVDIPYF